MNDSKKDNQHQLSFMPKDQPFNDEQRQWLGGFFAGLHSRLLVLDSQAPVAAAASSIRPITIIYGSQTGNAESVADSAAEQAKAQGLTPTVLDMDDVELSQFANIERLLVVTSTYGEGEMPDNAQGLWDAIESDDAPALNHMFFGVIALGDTSYDEFCLAGKLWDARLSELGAQRIAERIDCDIDFEGPAEQWLTSALPVIASKGSEASASGAAASTEAKSDKPAKSKYNRGNPLQATLSRKQVLTQKASSKEVMHFEFTLNDPEEVYDAGDALNIIPVNQPKLVGEVIEFFGGDAKEVIAEHDATVEQVLTNLLEIRTPSKDLILALATANPSTDIAAIVEKDDKAALNDLLWGKDSLDLLKAYANGASNTLSLNDFIALCKPLAPRAYSISSSIKKHPGEVHLTIGSVRYHAQDRDHNGVCSTYLADLAEVGDSVACYFSPNKSFSVPEDGSKPIIMVGPGTGIAPFRAFLEEREKTAASGANWLFFGDRNSETDFLYREELAAMQKDGVLTQLDLAFSRDQEEKVYVQDRMREKGAQLFAFLEEGGYFYICGDALRMAKDVDVALHDVIAEHGKLSPEKAADYVNALKKNKRYVRDVY